MKRTDESDDNGQRQTSEDWLGDGFCAYWIT